MGLIIKPQSRVRGVSIGAWFFDVTKSESFSASVQLAQDPIEDGAILSDHASDNPDRLVFTGIKTATPLDPTEQYAGRLEDAHAELTAILKAKAKLQVVSGSFGVFESMMLIALSSKLQAGTGFIHTISLTLQEVRVAVAEAVQIVAFIPKKNRIGTDASKAINEFGQTMEQVSQEVALNISNQSLLARINSEADAREAREKAQHDQDVATREELQKLFDDPTIGTEEKDLMRGELKRNPKLDKFTF